MLAEILPEHDPRPNSRQFKKAKEKEVSSLINTKVLIVVNEGTVPPNGIVLGGQLFLAIKKRGNH